MSYLFAVSTIVLFIAVLDFALGTKIFLSRKFWLFQLGVIAMTGLFDNWASSRLWIVNDAVSCGIKFGTTHIETVLFGFALLYLNLILFEKWLAVESRGKE
jgi:lycopene cyclase domain-containing protein